MAIPKVSLKVKAFLSVVLFIVLGFLSLWLMSYSQQASSPEWLQTDNVGYIMAGISLIISAELYHQSRIIIKDGNKQNVSTSTVSPIDIKPTTMLNITKDDNEKDSNERVIA